MNNLRYRGSRESMFSSSTLPHRRRQGDRRILGGIFIFMGICFLTLIFATERYQFSLHHPYVITDPRVQPVTMFIGLRPESQSRVEALERLVLEISRPGSPEYGKYLSIDEINTYIRSSAQDVRLVREWLDSYNIRDQTWYADAVKFRAPFIQVERLFGVHITTLLRNNDTRLLYPVFEDVEFEIPDRIREIIQVIDGHYHRVDIERRTPKPSAPRDPPTSGVKSDPGLVPTEVLRRLYQIPDGLLSSKYTSIGPIEYQGGNGFSQQDLMNCQKANNLPVQQIARQNLIGQNSYPDGESQLDVQMIAQVAPGAELWYEAYPGWMYAWATDFFNRPRIPYIISLSWGWNEQQQCSLGLGHCNSTSEDYVARCNYEFMKLAARGVTMLVSSGDAGSPGRTEEGCQSSTNQTMNPVFPGSSKWVTSVGATYLVEGNQHFTYHTPACTEQMNCANGTEEREVTKLDLFWTSGAGWDRWEQTPSWQYREVLNYITKSGVKMPDQKYWNFRGRAYPDVSAIGHNCAVSSGGDWGGTDGTSCSAPVFAGVIGVLNDHQMSRGKPRIGFANQMLYQMRRDDPLTFHDIAHGNSSCTEYNCCGPQYGFVAKAGMWDPVSGLGTPNVKRMFRWLDKHT